MNITIASSGSRLGSTPNSNSLVPPDAAPGTGVPIASSGMPRSPASIGEASTASESR